MIENKKIKTSSFASFVCLASRASELHLLLQLQRSVNTPLVVCDATLPLFYLYWHYLTRLHDKGVHLFDTPMPSAFFMAFTFTH